MIVCILVHIYEKSNAEKAIKMYFLKVNKWELNTDWTTMERCSLDEECLETITLLHATF